MNLILTVLNVTAPVFLLAAIGFAWVRAGFEYPVAFITRMAMQIAVPALVFLALMETEIAPSALTELLMATVAAYVLVSLSMVLVVLCFGLEIRSYLAPLIMGNTGNIGLPLALFAFGETGLGFAVVVFAVMAVYSFTIGVWIVSGQSNPMVMVKEPMVAATLLGAVFLAMDWDTPEFLTRALRLLGDMAIPMMLITLGVAVGRLQPAAFGRSMGLSLIKAVICAACGYGVAAWFNLPPVAAGVLVLQVATPVAVTNYLLAQKYEANADAVAGLVVTSTLLSVLVLPLLLSLFLVP